MCVSADNPALWLTDVLGVEHIYPKQQAMVEAVAVHTQVSTSGCNSSGKDFMAARIALWWIAYWRQRKQPAKVIITGPSARQVNVVWQEVRSAYLGAKPGSQGGEIFLTPLCRWDETTYILGFSTDKPFRLQGHHSPHLLVIVTEAHGVEESHLDALWRLNPNCMLLTGNPISETGTFYDSHHGKSHLWETISIDAFDTPNVIEGREVIPGLITREDIARHAANWGEDNPLYRMTVLNEWVEGMGNLIVVPLSWAQRAEEAEYEPGKIEVVACDPARFGSDFTTIYSRRGKVLRKLWKVQGFDLMTTTGWLKGYHDDHKFCHIIVDGTGVGSGIVDRLREQGVGVIDFQAGAAASDSSRYVNRTAEVWWRMREAYARGLDTEPDADLRGQVSSRKYSIQSDKRIQLQSKDDMRKAGRKSPDDGDAASMTFALDWITDGERLSASSDVPEDMQEAQEAEHDRASLQFGRGTDMSPWAGSRWNKFRGGRR